MSLPSPFCSLHPLLWMVQKSPVMCCSRLHLVSMALPEASPYLAFQPFDYQFCSGCTYDELISLTLWVGHPETWSNFCNCWTNAQMKFSASSGAHMIIIAMNIPSVRSCELIIMRKQNEFLMFICHFHLFLCTTWCWQQTTIVHGNTQTFICIISKIFLQ